MDQRVVEMNPSSWSVLQIPSSFYILYIYSIYTYIYICIMFKGIVGDLY